MKPIVNISILILLSSSLYAYYDYYADYLRKEIQLKQEKINIEKEKIRIENERIRAREIEKRNEEARIANERYYRSLQQNNKYHNNQEPAYVKKTHNYKKFKNKPQIILDDLHIIGIKSIKPFKKNKYIIKAANGTFWLPKDKFNKAKKINFTPKLMKIE